MPFTISHAVIVTPFTYMPRQYLSATGLIIGSMVPDFLYFILLDPYVNAGHSWWGIFVYDIPLALLLACLYHQVVKPIIMDYLPDWIGQRLRLFRCYSWISYLKQHYVTVLFSILLGVLSHLLLDAFTHREGYFVELLPALQKNVFLLHRSVKMYYLLQYISSLIGLMMMLYFFLKIPRVKSIRSLIHVQKKIIFWLAITVLTVLILAGNEYFHPIACKGMDYLAVIMGGIFYAVIPVVYWYQEKVIYKGYPLQSR